MNAGPTWPSTYTRQELLDWKEATREKRHEGEQYYLEEPGNQYSAPDRSHINRYLLAKSVKEELENIKAATSEDGPVRVIDAAMGCGYGGLVMQPDIYCGIDVQEYVVEYANRFVIPWMQGEAQAIKHDLEQGIPVTDNSVDMIVSFETIEHIKKPAGLKLMREVKRALKPRGVWLVSTPLPGARHELVSDYHVYEWEFTELFLAICQAGLQVKTVFQQTVQEPELVQIPNLSRTREKSDPNKIFYCVYRCEKPGGGIK
jgi:SAM-dependent methyltransferase